MMYYESDCLTSGHKMTTNKLTYREKQDVKSRMEWLCEYLDLLTLDYDWAVFLKVDSV